MKKNKIHCIWFILLILSNVSTAIIVFQILILLFNGDKIKILLWHTEQIKFILDSVDRRLQRDDKLLAKDIHTFNEKYIISTENSHYHELASEYMRDEYKNYVFHYQGKHNQNKPEKNIAE